MKVTYRERVYLDRFRCIDHARTFSAESYYMPAGADLYYFKTDRFNYKVISKDDIISLED